MLLQHAMAVLDLACAVRMAASREWCMPRLGDIGQAIVAQQPDCFEITPTFT